ncbi:MAG: tetratricopeptide repeat protein, partial [Xanthomonadales bacterium]|nr:tetratricopeptide repeat protein [Xanthomonadales bacterium]
IATLLLSDDNYGTTPLEEALSVSKLYLEKALSIEPDNPDALAGLGFNYRNQPGGRSVVEKAIPLLEQALAINPSMIDASNWLQQAYAAVGRGADAHRILEEMFNRDPLYKPAAGNLVFSYISQGRIEAAERVLKRIRPFIRDESFIARVHANILTNSGRAGEALPIARRSYEMDPNDGVAYAAIAWAMSNLGMDDAILELDAPFPFFKLQALTRLGRKEEGLKFAQEWSDRLGNPGLLIGLFHSTRQPQKLVDFVETRWPDLASFNSEFPGGLGFGHWNMISIAHAYRKSGNRNKFEQAMKYARASHDQHISEGFTSQIFYAAEASYWVLAGDTDRALDHLNTSILKGNYFPVSSVSQAPELDEILDNPRFRALVMQAHEKFNEQRVIAGLEPVPVEWSL